MAAVEDRIRPIQMEAKRRSLRRDNNTWNAWKLPPVPVGFEPQEPEPLSRCHPNRDLVGTGHERQIVTRRRERTLEPRRRDDINLAAGHVQEVKDRLTPAKREDLGLHCPSNAVTSGG